MSETKMIRGWGPFRYDWYSICSRHRQRMSGCDLCQHGMWINHWGHVFAKVVIRVHEPLWLWWVNRPNSRTNRFLRRTFPNLK